jgi:D-alanine-D-alanine ligase
MSKRRPTPPRPLRVMVLMHRDLIPPSSLDGRSDKEIAEWKTEFDVMSCLQSLGHDALAVGVHDDLGVIRSAIDEFRPHIVFNLLEEFHGVAAYNSSVVTYIELLRRPYTGCNPRGLLLARDKALSKQVLAYHRIAVPKFAVFPVGARARRPARLKFPLIVKSLTEQASLGIAHGSLVTSDERLRERVEFMHSHFGTDAIAEEYVDGRELYVGVIGNQRLRTLPVWEMHFNDLPEGAPRIATRKVKWDAEYQKRIKLETAAARDLPDQTRESIDRMCRRAYRTLGLSGYARMDMRLDAAGVVWLLEANPNPQLAFGEDFADSAAHIGIPYDALLQRILTLGLGYRPLWRTAG